MFLLYGCRQYTFDADSVAAHDGRNFFATWVQHADAHAVRVAVTQLEDVSNFDGFRHLEWTAGKRRTLRAAFALAYVAYIGGQGRSKISSGRYLAEMIFLP